jgi:phosphoglycolate phosphatase
MACADGSARTLVLWDIDRTLLWIRNIGSGLYRRAFTAATGRPLETLATFAGRTELSIMHDMLRLNGIEPTGEAIRALGTALAEAYQDAADALPANGDALPGARATLELLADEPRVHQGVLTGNLPEVAKVKLDAFALTGYLDLAASAYGNDHADRAELVPIARRRAAERTGQEFAHTVLIGDTPNDVRAALVSGAAVIAVATGTCTHADLSAAGAPVVLTDLTDPHRVAQLILTPPT